VTGCSENSTINAALVNQGLLVFRGGANNLAGSFENQAGGTLRVIGDGSFSGAQLTLALGFTNHGLIELTSVVNAQPATLIVTSGTLVNTAGAQINVLAGSGNGGRTLTAQLDNQGTLNVGTSLTINKGSAAHLNSGAILLTNGDLTLSQSGSPGTFTSTGSLDIGTNLTFTVSGGIFNYNSGTISGPTEESRGCMLELTWRGASPLTLPGGETRKWLEDDDILTITGWCEGEDYRVGFGEVSGSVASA
jgi:hypothetical protein